MYVCVYTYRTLHARIDTLDGGGGDNFSRQSRRRPPPLSPRTRPIPKRIPRRRTNKMQISPLPPPTAVGHTAHLKRTPSTRIFVFTHVFGFFDNPITYRSPVLSFGRYPCLGTCAPNFVRPTTVSGFWAWLTGGGRRSERVSVCRTVFVMFPSRNCTSLRKPHGQCKTNHVGNVSRPTDALPALSARLLNSEICKRPRIRGPDVEHSLSSHAPFLAAGTRSDHPACHGPRSAFTKAVSSAASPTKGRLRARARSSQGHWKRPESDV